MSDHDALHITTPVPNGFDLVEHDGKAYLRVITFPNRPVLAVPQTVAELRQLAAYMLNAADAAEARGLP